MGKPRIPPALAREWERKLRESGFVDSEDSRGRMIRHGHADRRSLSAAEGDGGVEYFRRAGHWLYFRVWRSRLHKRIWTLHAEGLTIDETVLQLGTWRGGSMHPVNDLIISERLLMGQALTDGSLELDDPDEELEPKSAFDEELESFAWVTRRGEGRGEDD